MAVLLRSVSCKQTKKSFKKMTSLTGSDVCAVDKPTLIFNVTADAAAGPSSACVPPAVQCAWRCQREPVCIGYNYKVDLQRCELHFYLPTNFTNSGNSSCTYFWVSFRLIYAESTTGSSGHSDKTAMRSANKEGVSVVHTCSFQPTSHTNNLHLSPHQRHRLPQIHPRPQLKSSD